MKIEDQRRGVDQVDQGSAQGFKKLLHRQRPRRLRKRVNELDVTANPRRKLLELLLTHRFPKNSFDGHRAPEAATPPRNAALACEFAMVALSFSIASPISHRKGLLDPFLLDL